MVVLHVGQERGFESGVSELVDAEGAKQGICSHAGDEIGAAADHAGLRAAQQFVSAIGDDVNTGAQAFKHARFVLDADRPQIKERAAEIGSGLTSAPSISQRPPMREGGKMPGSAHEARTASARWPRVSQIS